MKKILYAVMLLLGLNIIISCQEKSVEPESKGEVSIIGEWVSVNLDVLDEFATGWTYREASNDMKVVFRQDGMATFTYDGNSGGYPHVFNGKYELQEENGVKFLNFPEGLFDKDKSGYYISSSFDSSDGGSLVIRFTKRDWDWYDQWYFEYVKGGGQEEQDLFVEFEDANFQKYCIEHFDSNHDGEISYIEASVVNVISINEKSIISLSGIEHFTALSTLSCDSNQLTTLDVSKNPALTELFCGNNQLTTLDVRKNPSLCELVCNNNQLATLDVSKNPALTELFCSNNKLTTLDVSKNTELEMLDCTNNLLNTLDVSMNPALTYLFCSNNKLTTLDVSKNTALEMLDCTNNLLNTLDVSMNPALTNLFCSNNPYLVEICLKLGQNYISFAHDRDVIITYKD